MIPVKELWGGFGGEITVILAGYIDESYDSREHPSRMFSLTCTIARTDEWPWIEMGWQRCLDEKNAMLRKQGRKEMRRYHSTDINNFREDFEDWTGHERLEFCEKLVSVFRWHTLGYEGLLINLQEVVEEWPEISDPIRFAYYALLKTLMMSIGKGMTESLPGDKINLFHERCQYNGTYLKAFDSLMNEPAFPYRNCFTSIAPLGWEDCVALQPADLIAYENFKEGLRRLPGESRKQRGIFTAILSLKDFMPRLGVINRKQIIGLRDSSRAKLQRDDANEKGEAAQ